MVFLPPVLQAPAPQGLRPQAPAPAPVKTMPLADAEDALLLAFDEGRTPPPTPVAAASRAPLAWLRANVVPAAPATPKGGPAPGNPFRPGTPEHQEVTAWREFLKAPAAEREARLQQLPLALTGTQLGLWRWGQAMVMNGKLTPASRRTFEDRLTASSVALLRGYALRHALCHAVAEKDEGRFMELRQKFDFVEGDLFRQFQRLFSLLGGPAPVFRLYSLPGLDYVDASLGELGVRKIWMMPAEGPLEPLPTDVAWIIPSREGTQSAKEAKLDTPTRLEAEALARRFQEAGRTARFAASRGPFETYGLGYFPILIELDSEKRIVSIRLGDAAPLRP